MLAEQIDFVIGVDTHAHSHTAAIVTNLGGVESPAKRDLARLACRSRGENQPPFQQCEAGPAEHLPLKHLEPIDMPLGRTIAPAGAQHGPDRGSIQAETPHEAAQLRYAALFGVH